MTKKEWGQFLDQNVDEMVERPTKHFCNLGKEITTKKTTTELRMEDETIIKNSVLKLRFLMD